MSRGPSGLTRLCGSKGAVLLQEGVGLESLWPVRAAWVRIPLPAPETLALWAKCEGLFFVLTYPGGSRKDNGKRIVNRERKITRSVIVKSTAEF